MIDCAQSPQLGSVEYMARFSGRALRDRVPLSGSVDLTYRCNLRCGHCYARHLVGQTEAQAGELDTETVVRLLSQAADAGCMNLVLSGGEPLLRSDFAEIYRHACSLGLLTEVFTNATLIDDRVIEVFRDFPPRQVDVSIYGATAETSERVTGVPGAHDRAMRGIHRLLSAGIRVGLKTMILRENAQEVPDMEAFAESVGVRFRLDPLVVPRLDGDLAPLGQRIDPGRAAALEMASEKRRRSAVKYVERVRAMPEQGDLFQCGAGVIGFHIDPQGTMRPCLMGRDYAVDAVALGFAEAWRSVTEVVATLERKSDSACIGCEWRALCGFCVGLSALETGSPHQLPSYVCGLGERRLGIIQQTCEPGS